MQQSSHSVALPFSPCDLPCCSPVIFRLAVQTALHDRCRPRSVNCMAAQAVFILALLYLAGLVSLVPAAGRAAGHGERRPGGPRKSNLRSPRSRPRCNRADPAACHRCCRSSRLSIQAGEPATATKQDKEKPTAHHPARSSYA